MSVLDKRADQMKQDCTKPPVDSIKKTTIHGQDSEGKLQICILNTGWHIMFAYWMIRMW